MSLTDAVRAELAATALPEGPVGRAELSGLLRFSGVLSRRGGSGQQWAWTSTLRSTAARRADRLAGALFDVRCDLRARQVTAPRSMLLVELTAPASLLPPLALGPDVRGLPPWLGSEPVRWAYVRGVALAGLRLSGPARPHCEIQVPTARLAHGLADLLARLDVRASSRPHTHDRWRVVCKSRVAIGTLLAGTGATSAYLAWEDERARRSVRGAVARGVNADRANAQRSARAAGQQVAAVVAALADTDVDDLPEQLRATALARLANPTASLGELALVLDVSRATVSRRMQRLAGLAADAPHAPHVPPRRSGGDA